VQKLPPIELIRQLLDYDPLTGVFVWKHSGTEAGSIDDKEYSRICISNQLYTTSRLAWAHFHGEDPYPMEIDHINRIRWDNRIENLRKVSRFGNSQNTNLGESGVRGVLRDRSGKKWYGQITVDGKRIDGPSRATIEEAAQDRAELVRKYHPEGQWRR
jgi:hypothetical protein